MLQHHPILPQHDRNINEIEQLSSEWTNQIVQASLSAIPITYKQKNNSSYKAKQD